MSKKVFLENFNEKIKKKKIFLTIFYIFYKNDIKFIFKIIN